MGLRNRLLILFIFLTSGSAWGQEVIPGEYIVKFKQKVSHSQASNKVQSLSDNSQSLGHGRFFKLKEKHNKKIDIEALKRDPDVEFVEPNYVLHAFADCPTGVTTDCYHQTSNRVYATEAWLASSAYDPMNRPVVAVIDTGVDSGHDVFVDADAIWTNTAETPDNDIDDDGNGFVDDVNGWNFADNTNDAMDDNDHGTHVAGIVIGSTMDIIDSPITSSKIQVMPIKFLDSNGSGATSDAVDAVYYAVDNGAKVINNSWGGGSYSRALHDAFTYAYEHQVLIVNAAGNSSINNNNALTYPANYDVPSSIAVASVSSTDALSSFSNYGSRTVLLGAPGSLVESTLPGNGFGPLSGTSMAAPFVSGAAALAWREAPQLTGYQMVGLLTVSVDPVARLVGKVITNGRINVLSLVTNTQAEVATLADQPDYTPLYRSPTGAFISTTRQPDNAGCGLIIPKSSNDKDDSGGGTSRSAWPFVMFLLPLLFWFVLRLKFVTRLNFN